MSILVRVRIYVLGFYRLGALMGILEFCSPDCDIVQLSLFVQYNH